MGEATLPGKREVLLVAPEEEEEEGRGSNEKRKRDVREGRNRQK